MMELLGKLTDASSALIQTILWIVLIILLIFLFWRRLGLLLDILLAKIESGAPFSFGPFSVGAVPAAIRSGKEKTATSEGTHGTILPEEISRKLEEHEEPDSMDEEVYLIHATQVLAPPSAPGGPRYRVRLWLEAYSEEQVGEVERVTYRLHEETFRKPIIATADRQHEFELWLNIWGEFTVTAYVERKGKGPLWLSRYLDLPGRPEG